MRAIRDPASRANTVAGISPGPIRGNGKRLLRIVLNCNRVLSPTPQRHSPDYRERPDQMTYRPVLRPSFSLLALAIACGLAHAEPAPAPAPDQAKLLDRLTVVGSAEAAQESAGSAAFLHADTLT